MRPDIEKRLLDFMDDQREATRYLKTLVEPLFDNGQPGQLTKIHHRLINLETHHAEQQGMLKGVRWMGALVWTAIIALAGWLGVHIKGHP